MKEENKNPENAAYYIIYKQWKLFVLQTKILKELNKTDKWFYQNGLFVARKSQGLLKIRKRVDYWANLGLELH